MNMSGSNWPVMIPKIEPTVKAQTDGTTTLSFMLRFQGISPQRWCFVF